MVCYQIDYGTNLGELLSSLKFKVNEIQEVEPQVQVTT
jgi:hypothetical protein